MIRSTNYISNFFSRFLIVLVFMGVETSIVAQPKSQHGVLDSRSFSLEHDKLALNGDWGYFENQFVQPIDAFSLRSSFIEFPNVWNKTNKSGQGYATYCLKVILAKQTDSLAIEMPQVYSSYQLWVNGKLIGVNGKVGKTLAETVPQWLPQTVAFSNSSDTLEIVLQISNFNHHKGGIKDPIYLGSSELLKYQHSIAFGSNITESILLGTVGIIFLVLYLNTKKKKIIIYFALFCITWAIRGMFSNLYTFISFYPDFNWNVMVKIEYITLFLTMIWGILFLGRVLVKETNKSIKYLLVGSNVFFIIYALIMSPALFTKGLPIYLSFSGFLIIYSTILILKALINERLGAGFLTVSILLGICIFSYDIFTYEGFFTHYPIIFSVGYILIFSLMAVVLLLHLNIIKSKPRASNRLTFDDLYNGDNSLTKL
ncbi:MAG: 7TM-DISM domain-containing protein [Bacteroidia bacterium]|nr:7TM-DISM domain-containing protein [Bacteroidia bacterium]